MGKISISMSDVMEEYVAERVGSGAFNNTSEYFRDLVRRDHEKQRADDDLRSIIKKARKSGMSSRTPQEVWAAAEERYRLKHGGK